MLILEDENGRAREVTAEQFLDEAVPAWVHARGDLPGRLLHRRPTAERANSFAADLAGHGAAAVIATETSVTDRYATRVFART